MSILKKEYLLIPDSVFASRDIDGIFKHYRDEFFSNSEGVNEFVTMFLNVIKDFFEHKIDEEMLSSLIHKSLFDEKIKKYHYEPYLWSINDAITLLHELLDITWAKDSANYVEYLKELNVRFTQLVKKYDKYES